MADQIWYLKNCRLFERLTASQLVRLESRAGMRSFPRGSHIYQPSDPGVGVLLVAQGRVRLSSVTPDGKRAVLAFIEPGELFGELVLLDDGIREECAEAVVESLVIFLPTNDLRSMMEEIPDVSLGITKLIGFRRRRIERRLKSLLFRSNRDRLVHLLLELVEQYGQPDSGGVLVGIRLSHQDLASVIGSTRETVSVLLGELKAEGYVRVGRQRIVIGDLHRFAALLDMPAPSIPLPSPNTTDAIPVLGGMRTSET
ncbi:MAG: Crp/Fnr family transcriptional regulator [Planctomycetota bacterium]|nr:Crp/Fnr family transcriptional regulator [Planctomycetota bacterium]